MINFVIFEFRAPNPRENYKFFADLFVKSCSYYHPKDKIHRIKLGEDVWDSYTRSRSFNSLKANTIKINNWIDVLNEFDESDKIIFCDCDMMFKDNIADIFDYSFDIAYTERYNFKLPINGGLIALRNNHRSQDFIRLWIETNNLLMNNRNLHRSYQRRFGGINQSSLGKVLEDKEFSANVIPVPCHIYNCCDAKDFENHFDTAKVIHIKGNLRQEILHKKIDKKTKDYITKIHELVKQWENIECLTEKK